MRSTFGRGSLHHLLSNPTYTGRVPHKEESFECQYEAIVDADTWGAVQNQRADQPPPPARTDSDRGSSPLRGKLFDAFGARPTPSHSVKSGRRYGYNVSRHETNTAATALSLDTQRWSWRLPARELEPFVELAVLELFCSPEKVARLS